MSSQTFGRYIVTRLIGRGGMAEVYLAHDPTLDRDVAIKVIYPNLTAAGDFAERFRREAKLVASLRHPHIVQLHDFGIVDDKPYMVMEYLDGGSLKQRLDDLRARAETMSLGDTARLLENIASALDYAHGSGAIHRDVKPANILFTAQGEPVLTDFGIAKLLSDSAQLSASGSVVGTPAYMSPEQAQSTDVDARSDIYSLGIVLYEMAAGRVPFEGDSPTSIMMQHLKDAPPHPRQFNPNLPLAVQNVVLKALAKNPADRFASAGEFSLAFSAAMRGEEVKSAEAISTDAPTIVDSKPSPIRPTPATAKAEEGKKRSAAKPARWLAGLGSIAAMFAPLVGRQAPNVHEAQDRRGAIATVLGIIGILLATVQLLIGFFDIVSRPLTPIIAALPYLIALAFIVGAVLSLYVAARTPLRVRRVRALAVFAVIAAIGTAWGGWSAVERARPPSAFLVLISDFDGSKATRKVDFSRRIYDQIKNELQDTGTQVDVRRTADIYPDADTARARGAEQKATIVVWGWYDDAGVSPHVELLQIPQLARESFSIPLVLQTASAAAPNNLAAPSQPDFSRVARYVRTPETLPALDLFIRDGPQQITYASAALLGIAFYANGDSAHALALLDKALANAPAGGGDIVGQETVYFQRAVVLYQQSRVTDAVADLEKAIQIKPDLAEAHHNLAIAYAETCSPARQLDRAISEAKIAVRLKPDRAADQLLLADLDRQAGQYSDAINAAQAALRLEPDNPDAYAVLASSYEGPGQSDAAKNAQQRAIDLRAKITQASNSVETHLALGDAYLAAGQYDNALTEYQAAQQLAPDNASAQRGIGEVYFWKKQYDLAERAFKQWATIAPKEENPHLLLGLLYLQENKNADAITELKQATSPDTCDAAAPSLLGDIYFQQKDYANAANEFQSAANIEPQNQDYWYLLGVCQFFLNNYDAAAKSLQSALALKPDRADAHFALGEIYVDQKMYDKAASEWQQATHLSPNVAAYYKALAQAYALLGKFSEAATAYQNALALKDDADTHASLGLMYAAQRKYDAAIAEYQKALALDPKNFAADSRLGDALAQTGKLDDAITAYQTALAQQDDADVHTRLAQVYVQQGRNDAAVKEYESALALDPQNERAHLGLGNIYAAQAQLDDAAREFRAALAGNASSVQAHLALANVEYKRCNLSSATQEANAVVGLDPTNSLYRNVLASLYEAQGRTADAAKIYADLSAAPASDIFAHLAAGDYAARSARFDDAAREYQFVTDTPNLVPVFASLAHNALGQVYYEQGKLAVAQNEFNLALNAFPQNADAQLWLGDVRLRGGDANGALAAYDQVNVTLPAYAQSISADNAGLLGIYVQIRRALALQRLGNSDDAARALDQSQSLALALNKQLPQWALAHFALGLVDEARGEAAQAGVEFGTALQCDQSLPAARTRAETDLAKLRNQ